MIYLVSAFSRGRICGCGHAAPPAVADWCYRAVMIHHGNPFGVMRNCPRRARPAAAWPMFVEVNLLAAISRRSSGCAARRLKGHSTSSTIDPQAGPRQPIGVDRRSTAHLVGRAAGDGDRPRGCGRRRVLFSYAAFIIAGTTGAGWADSYFDFRTLGARWSSRPQCAFSPPHGVSIRRGIRRSRIVASDSAVVALRFDRPRLLASLAAAWRRGYDYLIFAGLLWVALAVSGRVSWLSAAAAALGGLSLWAFSFAVGFRAFCTGRQAGGLATALTIGLPLLLYAAIRANLEQLAALIPTAACYLPLKTGVTASWAAGFALSLAITLRLTARGLARCERDLRTWYDANQGRRTE